MNLTDLKTGESAALGPFGVTALHHRLLSMGIHPGHLITVIRRMPVRGNLFVEIGGRQIALRFAEAEHLQVSSL